MIVSKIWLSDYVSVDMPVDELTDRLTMSGLNLEGVEDVDGDVAIDLEVTSNRPDCLGHIGVAREVSVLFASELKIPDATVAESAETVQDHTSVKLDCPDLCHEYHARLIRGVQIGPSPDWLKDRLAAAGINSVNNVVDVTNYVMLESGQPLHAFDFDKLHGSRIVVRRANAGEKITAIDQREYELTDQMCVIADADRAVAVAGVMGGFDTEISHSTVNVLVETASFEPITVRSTARSLKLHSPSSFRFERRVDRRNMDWVSRRCCELIIQTAGGELCQGSIAVGEPLPPKNRAVSLRFSQVERLLGIPIEADECVRILENLGLKCVERNDDSAAFEPPGWRLDLTRECDLIEEVARIHGYDQIPEDATLPVIATSKNRREQVGDLVRSHLTACGLFESLTLSFVSEEQQQLFRTGDQQSSIAVDHSTRSLENQLRQSLIPSLLHCRRQNERHGTLNAELFEIAKVYLSAGEGLSEHQAEPTRIGLVSGRDFSAVKGLVKSLVERIAPSAVLTVQSSTADAFANGRGAELKLNGQPFGQIGELARSVTDSIDLQDSVSIAELDFYLLEQTYEPTRVYAPLPRFPSVSRDLNLVLPEKVTWAELETEVRNAGGSLLSDVTFGGQYRGKQIDSGKKSYLVTCRFMSPERTLTAEEVEQAVENILNVCQKTLEATLR